MVHEGAFHISSKKAFHIKASHEKAVGRSTHLQLRNFRVQISKFSSTKSFKMIFLIKNYLQNLSVLLAYVSRTYAKLRDSLQSQLSFFERRMFNLHEHGILETFHSKCKKTHQKKLHHLGIYNQLLPCDPDRVIHNLSSKPLPTRVKTLLAFGLEFKLPVWKLNFFHYHLSFEKVLSALSHLPLRESVNFDVVKRGIVSICQRYFQSFDASKVFSPIFSRADVDLL